MHSFQTMTNLSKFFNKHEEDNYLYQTKLMVKIIASGDEYYGR